MLRCRGLHSSSRCRPTPAQQGHLVPGSKSPALLRRTTNNLQRCRAAEPSSAEPVQQEEIPATASMEDPSAPRETKNSAFPYPMQLDQQQALLSSVPWPLFYPAMLACTGVAGAAGFGAGKALPGTHFAHRT